MYHSVFIAMFVLLTPSAGSGQRLFLGSDIRMIVNGGNIRLEGNWINDGLFTHKNGTLLLAGDTQMLSGLSETVFNNITVSAGSITSIKSHQSVKGILLCNGIVNADGNLTLLSTAAQTALIDGSGAGEVSGDLTMQRYLPSGFGYKYISSPFGTATVDELSDDLALTAVFPNVYRYDESKSSSGWVSYINPLYQLIPFNGYAANFGSDTSEKTIDITGVVNNHSQSVTIYNNNKSFTQGFNLVGNPFPSPINWDAIGWTKTNIDDAVYYFNAGTTNQYQGTYNSYVNGISSDGVAGNMIPSMQGFFVHVSDSVLPVTGVLAADNRVRTGNLSSAFYKLTGQETRPLIRISTAFTGKSISDPLVLYFDAKATPAFDVICDALKLMNTDAEVPSLYALSAGKRLSINAIPEQWDNDITIIPLGLDLQQGGMVHFKVMDMERLPYGCHPYLADIGMNIVQDLEAIPEYHVWLSSGRLENRFFLVFSHEVPSIAAISGDIFNAYTDKGKLFINLLPESGGKGEMIITSMAGQVVFKEAINGLGLHEFDVGWSSGIYIVSLVTGKGTFSKKLLISNE